MPRETVTPAPWDRKDARIAASMAVLALALRLSLALMTPVIGADSGAYLLAAHEFGRGDWGRSVAMGIHPGYPAAIAGAGALLGGLETAGYAVSVLFSSLAVGVFYVFVRDLAGRRVAALSALLFACLPYYVLTHADVMTEGLFHFFFVSSVTLAWFGVTRAAWLPNVLAGVSGAAAYLTRPEGIYLPIALLGLAVLAGGAARRRVLGYAALGAAVFILLAGPMPLWIGRTTGKWGVTPRVSAGFVATGLSGKSGDAEMNPYVSEMPGWGGALVRCAREVARVTMFLTPLALVGLAFTRGRFPLAGTAFLGCMSIGYSIAPLAARAAGYAMSDRHLLMPSLFLVPFISLGAVMAFDAVVRRAGPPAGGLLLAVFGIFLCGCVARAVHPRRLEDLSTKVAALRLRERAGEGARVRSNTHRIMYYMLTRPEYLPRTAGEIDVLTLEPDEFLFVVEKDYEGAVPGGMARLEGRFERIERIAGPGAVSIFAAQKIP